MRALAAAGPDAVRIEPLAKSLGVTRGGFYWHFEDRGALLAEMLETWERAARSMLAFSLLIGNHFMAADHGTRSRAEVLELAAGWLLA